jgi:hypothetical protein
VGIWQARATSLASRHRHSRLSLMAYRSGYSRVERAREEEVAHNRAGARC